MKKSFHLLGLCLLLLTPYVRAQYSVTALQPPPQFTFNDLWRVNVLRTAADSHDAFYLSLRIFNGNNLLKVKSNTAVLNLPVGATFFDLSAMAALQPFTTSYYDAGLLQQAVSSGGAFPPGNYTFSYTLFGKSADGAFQPLAEENAQALVEALWPPMLLSPPDGDTLDTYLPLLTWTPAFASYYNGPVEYALRLVELFPGQNAFQAISANPAYLAQAGIPVTTLPYPAAAQALDTGKVYAWQVHAYGAGAPMGSSEIWTFRLATPKAPKEKPVSNPVYFDIRRVTAYEVYHISDGYLYIRYEEEYATGTEQTTHFDVLDKHFKPLRTEPLYIVPSKGVNRIKINQCDLGLGTPKAGDYFYFRAKNQKGETFTLKFYPKADFTCR